MNGSRFVRPRLLQLLGLSLLLPLAAEAASGLRVHTARVRAFVNHYAVLPLANEALRPAEQAFLNQAIAHSRRETRLAELATTRAVSSDLRDLGFQMSGDHKALTERLETLRRQKGAVPAPPAVPPAASPPEEPVVEEYDRLVAALGADFDREFVLVLARLHDELVNLFEQAAGEAKDADVRDLAGGQLPLLRDHRNKLTQLRAILE